VAGFIPWRFFGLQAVLNVRNPADAAGFLIMLLGATVLLLCIAEFARRGRGTLSPADPPRHLVVSGLYRWVRNPMYLGVVLVLLGEVVVTGSPGLAVYAAAFFGIVNVFIIAYEEPYLARQFGESYTTYQAHVGRWIPRTTPWHAPGIVTAATTKR
jgi:protein-S-isoprenylcysteine O-methyltransferase Ste14